MKKVVLCREEAQKAIDAWLDAWDFEDPKSITTGGKESSIEEDQQEAILAAVMMGRLNVPADGGELTYELSRPVTQKDGEKLTKISVTPKVIKNHMLTATIAATDNMDRIREVINMYTPLGKYEFSELTGKDTSVLIALTSFLNFM